MGADPRKVDKISIEMNISENKWDEQTLNKIIKVARSCPVELTLKNNVQIDYKFN